MPNDGASPVIEPSIVETPAAAEPQEAVDSSAVESQEAVKGSTEADPVEKAVEATKRKLTIKTDGREEELDEEDVIKLAQLGRASNKRFQEAAQMRKQAENFISLLQKDPLKVLSDPSINVNVREFAEQYLLREIEKETLSPEQRQIAEYEEKLRAIDDEKKTAKEQQETEERDQLRIQYSQEYEGQIQDALSSTGLPRTHFTVRRMVEYMTTALNNGIDLPAKNVAALVRQDYLSDMNSLIGHYEGDQLIAMLGDGVANKIRLADLARLEAGTYQGSKSPKQEVPLNDQTPAAPTTPMSIHEWREYMDSKRKK